MTAKVGLYVRSTPGIFDIVRKWRCFCADTDLDMRSFAAGTSDVRILERSVLPGVRQRATSVSAEAWPYTSCGIRKTMWHDGRAQRWVAAVHGGVRT